MTRSRSWRARGRRAGWAGGLAVLLTALVAVVALDRCGGRDDVPGALTGSAHVVDGDTLEIRGRRVRLFGVDAPEYTQSCSDAHGRAWPCGRHAARELTRRLKGRTVTCDRADVDVHGRTVARCAADGEDIAAWLVRTGAARAFKAYAHDYLDEEREAKDARRGIWQGAHDAPWEWRSRRHSHPNAARALVDW